MITATSTPAEVIAHHRQAIADLKNALAGETGPGERLAILKRIEGHRARLATAEAKPWTPADAPGLVDWIASEPTEGARTWTEALAEEATR